MVETLRQAIEHWLRKYGPEPGPPPESIVDALVALHREELPNVVAEAFSGRTEEVDALVALDELPDVVAEAFLRRTEEIVVAFGAGWRREALGEEGWEGRWPHALDWVGQRVHDRMLAAVEWLYEIPLQGFAYTVPFPHWEGLVWEIAHDLLEGTCGCWRVFYPEAEREHRRDVRRAQERARRCGRTHHLAAWNPSEMSLWDFIERAVKGDRRKKQQRGNKVFAPVAFSYSMFFRHLYEDHDVRCGNVLSWRCPHHAHIPFEGPQCLECKDRGDSTIFDATKHHRRVQMRLLVAAPTGRYAWQRFWRCQKKTCGNYYPDDLRVCPLCQQQRTRGAARSIVWMLGPRVIMQRDQHTGWEAHDLEETVLMRLEVRAAVDQLPPDLRKIVDMCCFDRMTEDEIADELQCPLEEIQDAMEEAREQLAALLGFDLGHADD